MRIKVAIIGISGYTGEELLKLLLKHPKVELCVVAGNSSADRMLSSIYPTLCGPHFDLLVQKACDVDFTGLDVAFFCLPHTKSQALIRGLPAHLKVIDLSADFRLSVSLYEQWYEKHLAPTLQEKFVYGLTEFNRNKIASAQYIACPGCYPTSVLLPLLPLALNGMIDLDHIIVDSKSGISGAGREPTPTNVFCNISNNFIPYKIGCHRHLPEMELILSMACSRDICIEFLPNIVPAMRGIISSIYCKAKAGVKEMQEFSLEYYKNSKFVELVNYIPSYQSVVFTNYLRFAIYPGRTPGMVLIISAIDNLLKGASGQAVQNLNVTYGLDEALGLV